MKGHNDSQSQAPVGFRGGLAVFSGPSGSGKTSICTALLQDPRLTLSISVTTRAARPGDEPGVHYHFCSKEEFLRQRDAGELAEWAEVYGNYYGTPLKPLLDARQWTDEILLLDIDVQGAAQLRGNGVQGTFVFIEPPSLEVLRQRLEARGSDSPETVQRRLQFAQAEMDRRSLYDHVLVNENLDQCIEAARVILGL